jgi:hypothetical protein
MHWLAVRKKLTAEPPSSSPGYDGTPSLVRLFFASSAHSFYLHSNYWQDNPWRPYTKNSAGAAEQVLVWIFQQQGGMAGFHQQ